MPVEPAIEVRRKKTKRFVRPDELPEYSLTQRGLSILGHVARNRLIASDDLAVLDGGSAQNVKRELRLLWAHGYLMRPAAQLCTTVFTGPQPMVYGLTNKGARLLHREGCRIDTEIDWSENTRRSGVAFIDHSVARSRFMAGVEAATRRGGDIEFVSAREIIAASPEHTRNSRQPLKWVANVPMENGRIVASSVIADDLFALRFSDNTESNFLVEIDRGQMPVRRSGNATEVVDGKRRMRTHYMHKLATYWHGWKQERQTKQFGVEQVRVLTVTTSAKRIETMLGALRDVTGGKGSDMFLFIDDATLRERKPLDAPWVTGKGRECRIVD